MSIMSIAITVQLRGIEQHNDPHFVQLTINVLFGKNMAKVPLAPRIILTEIDSSEIMAIQSRTYCHRTQATTSTNKWVSGAPRKPQKEAFAKQQMKNFGSLRETTYFGASVIAFACFVDCTFPSANKRSCSIGIMFCFLARCTGWRCPDLFVYRDSHGIAKAKVTKEREERKREFSAERDQFGYYDIDVNHHMVLLEQIMLMDISIEDLDDKQEQHVLDDFLLFYIFLFVFGLLR